MSFGMIFSIILIVFFIVAAFVAIRFFLNYQRCSQVGLFLEDLQAKVDEAFNSPSASFYFNSTLPSGVKAICFLNLSAGEINADTTEKGVWSYIQEQHDIPDFTKNTLVYSPDREYCVKWKTTKHIDVSLKNPNCIEVKSGKISIKVERKFDYPLVILS
jgi:hypothetical protein